MADDRFRDQREEELLKRLLHLAGNRMPVPEAVMLRVKQNVRTHWKQQLRFRAQKRKLWILSATLAACFLFFLIAWYSLAFVKLEPETVAIAQIVEGRIQLAESIPSAGDPIHAGSRIETGVNSTLSVRMLGGIRVRIGESSIVHFSSSSDILLTSGVVDLDTGTTRRHISVSTSMGRVTDVGTNFQVRLNENKIEISVREGSVFLRQNGKQTHSVIAGNRLTANSKGEIFVTKFEEMDWPMNAFFQLEGRSLMDFLTWITEKNGWTLRFANTKIERSEGQIILHGSIAALSPEQMLRAVLPVCGLSFRLNEKTLTIDLER